MKITIDARPADPQNAAASEPSFIVRLFPETNKDMADMEWGLACELEPQRVLRITAGEFHYAIIFGKGAKA